MDALFHMLVLPSFIYMYTLFLDAEG